MIKELKRQWVINDKDYLGGAAIMVGVALFLIGIFAVIARVSGGMVELPQVGSFVFYFGGGLYILILMVAHIGVQFNLALKMGAVRHLYLPATLLLCFSAGFAIMLLPYLWYPVETLLYRAAGIVSLGGPLLPVYWVALLAFGVCLVGAWMGALIVRYGKVGFWIMWGLWMFVSVFGTQIGNALSPGRTDGFARFVQGIAGFLGKLPLPGLWGLAALAVVAMAAHTWLILRRMRVTD